MACLTIDNDELSLSLSPLEKVGALHGDVRVPLTAVRSVTVAERPRVCLSGVRTPGTWLPGVVRLGTWRGLGQRTFVAAYGRDPAVVVELVGERFDQLVISSVESKKFAARLRRATAR